MKTVIFDFDGTLHLCPTAWKAIWQKLGYSTHLGSDFVNFFSSFMEGEISHKEWCDLSAKAFRRKSLKRDLVEKIGQETILIKNVEKTFQTLKQQGYHIIILSGGIREVIQIALGEAGKYVDNIMASDLIYDKNGLFKSIKGTNYDYNGKANFVKEYIGSTNSTPEDITFVGDGDNDEWVHTSGCNTICINPKKNTDHENRTKWHQVLFTDDFEEVLPLIENSNQGESQDENYI